MNRYLALKEPRPADPEPVGLCEPRPYDQTMVEWIYDQSRVVACRVRRVGSTYIEIHPMAFNLRVVLTDVLRPLDGQWHDFLGYGWCYPKVLGYSLLSTLAWAWEFDPTDPARVNPPGPWIKAVHSGVYREPGIGQMGPEGLMRGRDGQPRILCPQCDRSSPHPDDIASRYCPFCHQFHDLLEVQA